MSPATDPPTLRRRWSCVVGTRANRLHVSHTGLSSLLHVLASARRSSDLLLVLYLQRTADARRVHLLAGTYLTLPRSRLGVLRALAGPASLGTNGGSHARLG